MTKKIYIVVAYDYYYPSGNNDIRFVTDNHDLATNVANDYRDNGIVESDPFGNGRPARLFYDCVEVITKEIASAD